MKKSLKANTIKLAIASTLLWTNMAIAEITPTSESEKQEYLSKNGYAWLESIANQTDSTLKLSSKLVSRGQIAEGDNNTLLTQTCPSSGFTSDSLDGALGSLICNPTTRLEAYKNPNKLFPLGNSEYVAKVQKAKLIISKKH